MLNYIILIIVILSFLYINRDPSNWSTIDMFTDHKAHHQRVYVALRVSNYSRTGGRNQTPPRFTTAPPMDAPDCRCGWAHVKYT